MTEAMPRRENARAKTSPEQPEEKTAPSSHWRALFIERLAETSCVADAARHAGIEPSRAYKARRQEPSFARQWRGALLEGFEHLQMETLHRLRSGTATGKDDPKFDIANALRLLALHRDAATREKARQDEEDEDEILATLDARIEEMRARELASVQLLAQSDDAGAHVRR